jgi:NADH:ubiquinone oxidoreductase subunit E
MGSSCFDKGNSSNAEYIIRFIEEHNLQEKIGVSGCLCGNACALGPNIRVNNKLISGISEQAIVDIIVKELELQL